MRVLFLGNNWLGWKVLECLRRGEDELVGLVVHPPERRKFGDEILRAAGLDSSRVFDGSRLRDDRVLEAVRRTEPEIGLSVMFGYILQPEFLNIFPRGCVNLHTSFLPYNRGAHPNVWSIIDETPAGVTMHYLDDGIDTGDIITQKQVPVEPEDTAATLYHKLEQAGIALFEATWPRIRSGTAVRIPQRLTDGTCHRVRDLEGLDEIDLNRCHTAKELINLLRARTFPPYRGAYFRANGKKVYLELRLYCVNEV